MLRAPLSIIMLSALLACSPHQTNGPVVVSGDVNQPAPGAGQNSATPTPLPVAAPTPREEIPFGRGLRIVSKNVKLENERSRYKIDVDYPQIEGTKDAAILSLNRSIKDLVTKKYEWPLSPPTKKDLRYYAKWPGVYNSVDVEYDVLLATDELLSIYLIAYHYGIGAAHSVHESFTVNYDFKSHRLLTLAGVFKPGAKHLQFISQRCIDQLSKKNPTVRTDPSFGGALSSRSKNFESWNMTQQGLRINFDACKIDGCAAGDLSVEIPFDELKPLLNSNVPWKSLLR